MLRCRLALERDCRISSPVSSEHLKYAPWFCLSCRRCQRSEAYHHATPVVRVPTWLVEVHDIGKSRSVSDKDHLVTSQVYRHKGGPLAIRTFGSLFVAFALAISTCLTCLSGDGSPLPALGALARLHGLSRGRHHCDSSRFELWASPDGRRNDQMIK